MRLALVIVLLLFIGGCGQNRESGPVKEVSGEMNNGSVVLTVSRCKNRMKSNLTCQL